MPLTLPQTLPPPGPSASLTEGDAHALRAGPHRARPAAYGAPLSLTTDLARIVRLRGGMSLAQHSADRLQCRASVAGTPRRLSLQELPKGGGTQMLAYIVDHALRLGSSEDAATAAQLARSLAMQARQCATDGFSRMSRLLVQR